MGFFRVPLNEETIMQVRDISACITTDRLEETRAFFIKHLGARVTFDCGWYINLEFGERGACLQFMKPQHGEALCAPAGLTYNLHVEDVDMECARILASGIEPIMPITDHPWGDRAFSIQDPNGVLLYIYTEREPSSEYKEFYTGA